MTPEESKKEEEIRRFLFGAMGEDERIAFEHRFIAEDDGLFDEIRVIEDDLIEAYVRGTLSANDKTAFERNFLNSETRRRRVDFARRLFDKLGAEGRKPVAAAESADFKTWFFGLFGGPRLAFAAAFVVLAAIAGISFLLIKNRENGTEIARESTPTPTPAPRNTVEPRPTPAENVNVKSPEPVKTPANANIVDNNVEQPAKSPPKNVTVTLALFAGTIRGEGKMRELALTNETTAARFELNLDRVDYKTYRAEIVDQDGGVIYKSGRLGARQSKIAATFPTSKLGKGDYFVKVYGFTATGEEESAADFAFRVTRK